MSIDEQICILQDEIMRMSDAVAGIDQKIKVATCDLNLVGDYYRKEIAASKWKLTELRQIKDSGIPNKKLALSKAEIDDNCLACEGTGSSICDRCGGTGKDAGNI